VIDPNGAGSRCLRARSAYCALVDSARLEAASVVARQCVSHDATDCLAATTGAPSSIRLRASFSLVRTLAAVGPVEEPSLALAGARVDVGNPRLPHAICALVDVELQGTPLVGVRVGVRRVIGGKRRLRIPPKTASELLSFWSG
jgi:hypothetical protein